MEALEQGFRGYIIAQVTILLHLTISGQHRLVGITSVLTMAAARRDMIYDV